MTAFGMAFFGEAAEVGVYDFAKDYSALVRSGGIPTPELARKAVLNFSLAPPLAGAQVGIGSMMSHYELPRGWNVLYDIGKNVPLVGAGLELGETINACSGRMP